VFFCLAHAVENPKPLKIHKAEEKVLQTCATLATLPPHLKIEDGRAVFQCSQCPSRGFVDGSFSPNQFRSIGKWSRSVLCFHCASKRNKELNP
jgi:hypothetical protein